MSKYPSISRIILAAASAALCVAGLAWLATRAFGVVQKNSAEVAALRSDLARLRQADVGSRVGSGPRSASLGPVQDDTVGRGAVTPLEAVRKRAVSREDQDRLIRLLHQSQVQLLDGAFDTESADPTWAPNAEVALKKLYSGPEFAALRTVVVCKSTLCRVNFQYTEPKLGKAAVLQMLTRHPWRGRTFNRNDVNNRSGFSYVGREGTSFPRVDPQSLAL